MSNFDNKKPDFGYMSALVTPFKDGEIDVPALVKLLERQKNLNGIVIAGTTAEAATLSNEERALLMKTAREVLGPDYFIMLGVGGNDTRKVVELAQNPMGADAYLVVTPYYNKPTQEGLYRHYTAVADASPVPVFLYNVPGRTACDLSAHTTGRLSKHPNIVGIKDATGSATRAIEIRCETGEDFILLSGDDGSIVSFIASGGNGAISVTSNIVPNLCAKLFALLKSARFEEGRKLQEKLMKLHDILFIESSPAPAKFALSHLGLCRDELRLPLVSLSAHHHDRLKEILDEIMISEKDAA